MVYDRAMTTLKFATLISIFSFQLWAGNSQPGDHNCGQQVAVNPKQVLMVDSDEGIANAVAWMLKRHGMILSSATSVAKGLALLEGKRFDAVIVSANLERYDCGEGFRLLDVLKTNPDTATIPVITLSTCNRGIDKDIAEQRGTDAFLPKPFSNRVLLEELQELFKRAKTKDQ